MLTRNKVVSIFDIIYECSCLASIYFFFFAVYFTYAQSRTAQPLNIHSYVVVVLTNKTEHSHMLTAVN